MPASDSIIAVNFFAQRSPADFGQFDLAFVSLFRILSGDTWPPDLSVLASDGSAGVDPFNAIFIISFRLIVDWILLQVITSFSLRDQQAVPTRHISLAKYSYNTHD